MSVFIIYLTIVVYNISMSDKESKYFSCSFCKRSKSEVQKLIAGKSSKGMITFICNICTEICYLALKGSDKVDYQAINLLKPHEIYEELGKHVHGQDEAKKILAVTAYNHYKRILFQEESKNIDKSNVLMIGKSGSGKTLLIETLSKILNVPFISIDVTTMTEAGYVGDDVDVCISRLFQAAKGDIKKTERGIVFLDEFDKLRKKSQSSDGAMDVSGVGVQYSLLKLIEGTTVHVSPSNKKGYSQSTIAINTKDIWFICAGAFEDVTKIIEKDVRTSIGFHQPQNNNLSSYDFLMSHLNNEHLIKYGMIPEILGRLQIHVALKELTVDDLMQILTEPQNAILTQYKNLLNIKDKAKLLWTDSALRIIAERAIKSKAGARGLKSIIEKILLKIMFDIPNREDIVEVTIDEGAADGSKIPELVSISSKNN